VVLDPGWFFRIHHRHHAGRRHVFLMWLGEQITARGVGQRHLAHHLAGIVAQLRMPSWARSSSAGKARCPDTDHSACNHGDRRDCGHRLMERAQRRLLVQYPKRQVGNRMFQGDASHLRSMLNSAGVIPPIFASSLLLLPITVANFSAGQGPRLAEHRHRHARTRPAATSSSISR